MWNSISLSLTPTLLPAAIVIQPAEVLDNPPARTVPGHAVYGFAVAPLGLTADLARRHRVHPFLETMEGMIASTEPIPENRPNATGLNFLFDLNRSKPGLAYMPAIISFLGYNPLDASSALGLTGWFRAGPTWASHRRKPPAGSALTQVPWRGGNAASGSPPASSPYRPPASWQ